MSGTLLVQWPEPLLFLGGGEPASHMAAWIAQRS